MRAWILVSLGVATAICGQEPASKPAAMAPSKGPVLEDKDGKVRIVLPPNWRMELEEPVQDTNHDPDNGRGVICRCTVRDAGDRICVLAIREYSTTGPARLRAVNDRDAWRRDRVDARFVAGPIPHTIVKEDKRHTFVTCFVDAAGRGYLVSMSCHNRDLGAWIEGLIAAARSLKSDRPRHWDLPAGFLISKRDSFDVFFRREQARQAGLIQAKVAKVVTLFTELHGDPGLPAGQPLRIVLVEGRVEFAALNMPRRGDNEIAGAELDDYCGTIAVIGTEQRTAGAALYWQLWQGLLRHRYGRFPRLLSIGEAHLVKFAFGDDIPFLTVPQRWKRQATINASISDLQASRAFDEQWDSLIGYAAMFRSDNGHYGKVFRAYLDDLWQSGDPEVAGKRLDALDQRKVREDLQTFIRTRLKDR